MARNRCGSFPRAPGVRANVPLMILNPGEPICYGQVNQGRWCQEHYESASRHAAIRAKQLRQAGYDVVTSSLGPQVTPVGVVKMSMVDIRPGRHAHTMDLPPVKMERLNPRVRRNEVSLAAGATAAILAAAGVIGSQTGAGVAGLVKEKIAAAREKTKAARQAVAEAQYSDHAGAARVVLGQ